MNITQCGICRGIKHVDAACHYCGAIKIGHKHYNVLTLREMYRPKTSIVHRAETILYNRRVSDGQVSQLARLSKRVSQES